MRKALWMPKLFCSKLGRPPFSRSPSKPKWSSASLLPGGLSLSIGRPHSQAFKSSIYKSQRIRASFADHNSGKFCIQADRQPTCIQQIFAGSCESRQWDAKHRRRQFPSLVLRCSQDLCLWLHSSHKQRIIPELRRMVAKDANTQAEHGVHTCLGDEGRQLSLSNF